MEGYRWTAETIEETALTERLNALASAGWEIWGVSVSRLALHYNAAARSAEQQGPVPARLTVVARRPERW